jgi:hypothetical protein
MTTVKASLDFFLLQTPGVCCCANSGYNCGSNKESLCFTSRLYHSYEDNTSICEYYTEDASPKESQSVSNIIVAAMFGGKGILLLISVSEFEFLRLFKSWVSRITNRMERIRNKPHVTAQRFLSGLLVPLPCNRGYSHSLQTNYDICLKISHGRYLQHLA